MKRVWLILGLGVMAAVLAYGVSYYARRAAGGAIPAGRPAELAWLKREFRLSDAEFTRIAELHGAYLPRCMEMCRRIEAINQRLRGLLAVTNRVTPEIEQALAEAARVRVDCQTAMLNHFYEVSRSMPPAQGQRYLEWMQSQTLLPTYHTAEELAGAAVSHAGHGH
jgi:hypothetical protein